MRAKLTANSQSPEHQRMKTTKKLLRSAQRKLAAQKRHKEHEEIMQAQAYDKVTFYKLVQKQRGGARQQQTVSFPDPNAPQIEGWADYFQELATPVDEPRYSKEFKSSSEVQHLLLKGLNKETGNQFPQVTPLTVQEHITSLKNGKACDVFGISAEHVKYASPMVATVLSCIINLCLERGQLVPQFKTGVITPVPKKGKPPKNPDSYRRITVNSILGKVLEKELLVHTKKVLNPQQHGLQFGFTEKCSSTNCALMLTEAIAEAQDNKQTLYITFMDAKKAFDVVWHDSLLVSLHNSRITGNVWSIYDDMYSGMCSRVKVGSELSRVVKEGQGIRQGGQSSTDLFKCRSNKMLQRITELPDSFRIGSISLGAPTTADDTALLSATRVGAQTQINVAQDDANNHRYNFSTVKTKAIVINPSPLGEAPLRLNNLPVDISHQETHLGLQRTPDSKAEATIKERIKSARRAAYSLMGAGLHGLNGVGPKVSKHLIEIYVTPVLLHSLEALILSEKDYKMLDQFYRTLLRQIQHLPTNSAIPSIYLLLGCIPIEGQLHIRMLTFFCNILRRTSSVERQVVERQLALKGSDTNSWTKQIKEILWMYGLPSAYQLLKDPPRKKVWKKAVDDAVGGHWFRMLKEKAATMSTLRLLDPESCALGSVHPIWDHSTDPMEAHMATVKARLLLQRYPLSGLQYSGRKMTPLCPICHEGEETVEHFLLTCAALHPYRTHYLQKIYGILVESHSPFPSNIDDITRLVMDPQSRPGMHEQYILVLEEVSRKMTYKLHNERSIMLGGRSSYSRASCSTK